MKKFLLLLLLLSTVFCCSCDFTGGFNKFSSSSVDSSSSESESQVEINSESVVEQESEQESASESSTESQSKEESSEEASSAIEEESAPESSSVIESESEIESESTSESESEAETELETEVIVPVKKEYGSFSYAITETKQSADRLKQMAGAEATYNKGATCSDSELKSILSSANTIKSGGSLLNYKNASKLMAHFLGNTGEVYTIDMSVFLKDANALKTRNEEINKALRACEQLAIEGESLNIFQKEEIVHHNLTGDWKFAVGSYFTSIEIKDLTVSSGVYSATIVYKATDFYNWDFNNDTPVFSGYAAMLVGDVSPKDLHQLHRAGKAQEFLSQGEISYTVTWSAGSDVSEIYGFNN